MRVTPPFSSWTERPNTNKRAEKIQWCHVPGRRLMPFAEHYETKRNFQLSVRKYGKHDWLVWTLPDSQLDQSSVPGSSSARASLCYVIRGTDTYLTLPLSNRREQQASTPSRVLPGKKGSRKLHRCSILLWPYTFEKKITKKWHCFINRNLRCYKLLSTNNVADIKLKLQID